MADRVAAADGRIFIGTLEGEHCIDALLPSVTASGAKAAWLLPLLSIIGKHAEQDMAGDGLSSWRGRLESAGIACRPVLTGTVEYDGFARIWIDHLRTALERLAA